MISREEEKECDDDDNGCDADDDDDCEDCDADDDDDDDEDNDDEEEEDDKDKHGDKYKKDKYKKDKKGYGGDEEEYGDKGKYKKDKKKTKKYVKKSEKKTYSKPSYGSEVDKEDDDEEDEYDSDGQSPTYLSYANSNNRPIQTLFPWLKNLFPNDKTSAVTANAKDTNIMSSPNGFPIGGSKLDQFQKRSDYNNNKNIYLEDLIPYQPSESEIRELLSNPQVIEFLYKLNESLSNETTPEEYSKQRPKRHVKQNNTHTFTAEESRQSLKQMKNIQFSNDSKTKNKTNSAQNYLKSNSKYTSSKGQKSSHRSVDPMTKYEPQESVKSTVKSYKLGDYISFKPLIPNYKTSQSMNRPSYDNIETTDDDEYPTSGQSLYGGSQYPSDMSGHSYGGAVDMPSDYNSAYGGLPSHNSDNQLGYNPMPVMDLSYWSKVMKKNQKKPKKNKYLSTESYPATTEGYDEEEEEEEELEDFEPSKKVHTTIQVIKSGSKTGNIGIGNSDDEDRSFRGWVRGLPGFRSLFGKR